MDTPGWPRIQRSTCLCLWSEGSKVPPHLAIAFKNRVRAHVDAFLHGATVRMWTPEEMYRVWIFFLLLSESWGPTSSSAVSTFLPAESIGVLGILRVLRSVWQVTSLSKFRPKCEKSSGSQLWRAPLWSSSSTPSLPGAGGRCLL